MDGAISGVLLAGFVAIVGVLAWRTAFVFWPYLLPLVAGLLLTVNDHVVLGGLILLGGFFGGARWLERKRLDVLLHRRRRHPA